MYALSLQLRSKFTSFAINTFNFNASSQSLLIDEEDPFALAMQMDHDHLNSLLNDKTLSTSRRDQPITK